MACHPAYPTAADLGREDTAEARDASDLCSLRDLRRIVAEALIAARQVDEIRHPDRRFTTAVAVEVLEDTLLNIAATEALVMRRPVVIEDEG